MRLIRKKEQEVAKAVPKNPKPPQNTNHCPSSYDRKTWTHCVGTKTYANGNKYVGDWKDGKKHGQGILTYGLNSQFAGGRYAGEYKNGKGSGQGILTSADGKIEEGLFEKGKLVRAQ